MPEAIEAMPKSGWCTHLQNSMKVILLGPYVTSLKNLNPKELKKLQVDSVTFVSYIPK